MQKNLLGLISSECQKDDTKWLMNYESSHSEDLILQVAFQAACNNKWVMDEQGISGG